MPRQGLSDIRHSYISRPTKHAGMSLVPPAGCYETDVFLVRLKTQIWQQSSLQGKVRVMLGDCFLDKYLEFMRVEGIKYFGILEENQLDAAKQTEAEVHPPSKTKNVCIQPVLIISGLTRVQT